jgi:hypothetical protein
MRAESNRTTESVPGSFERTHPLDRMLTFANGGFRATKSGTIPLHFPTWLINRPVLVNVSAPILS